MADAGVTDATEAEAEALRRRQELILGAPPRIAALAPEERPHDERAVADTVRDAAGGTKGDPDITSDQIPTLMRHPELFRAHAAVGVLLLSHGALDPRHRELAILRTGWLCRAPFEWGEHVKIAKRAGVTSEEVERITRGSQATGWTDLEAAILRAVEELHADAMITDATWAALSDGLSDKQLIELVIVVGQYHTVAFYQNALRLRVNRDNLGLFTR